MSVVNTVNDSGHCAISQMLWWYQLLISMMVIICSRWLWRYLYSKVNTKGRAETFIFRLT
jgi:hypothetical protein